MIPIKVERGHLKVGFVLPAGYSVGRVHEILAAIKERTTLRDVWIPYNIRIIPEDHANRVVVSYHVRDYPQSELDGFRLAMRARTIVRKALDAKLLSDAACTVTTNFKEVDA